MTNNQQPQADLQLTTSLLEGLVTNGPTDPIAYYRRPLIGRFFRERINLGLRMIADRRYAKALEVGYGAGAVLRAIAASVDELHGIDLDADPAITQAWLASHGRTARLSRAVSTNCPTRPRSSISRSASRSSSTCISTSRGSARSRACSSRAAVFCSACRR